MNWMVPNFVCEKWQDGRGWVRDRNLSGRQFKPKSCCIRVDSAPSHIDQSCQIRNQVAHYERLVLLSPILLLFRSLIIWTGPRYPPPLTTFDRSRERERERERELALDENVIGMVEMPMMK